MSIRIDKEFESLIPPLTDDEFKQLEENCVRDGIRDPLVLWRVPNGDDILIDGHNRWKIAAQHGGMPFETVHMEFDNRDQVKAWIYRNQLGRRNLDKWTRFDMVKALEPLIRAEAKKRQAEYYGNQHEKGGLPPKSAEVQKGETRDKMAELVGVGHDTYRMMKRIDEMATPYVKAAVRKGDLSINKAFNTTFPSQKDRVKVAKEEHERFKQNKGQIVNFQDAQIDQMNQKIISNAMTQEVLKLLSSIEKFGFIHKEEELKVLRTELDDTTARNLIGTIKNCYMILEKIQDAIGRR